MQGGSNSDTAGIGSLGQFASGTSSDLLPWDSATYCDFKRRQMGWNGKNERNLSVQERGFTLDVDGRTVPGVYWSPAEGPSDRLVLLGHGGSTHKKVEYIEQVAMLLAGRGISAMAIDGPGLGERGSVKTSPEDAAAGETP